jgi:2-dehydro-3-deoxygluconokinase
LFRRDQAAAELPGFERFFQSPALQATFGGGEANVAVSLAHFGFDSHYVTRVPSNAVGDAAVRALRAEGVNVGYIVRGGSRRHPTPSERPATRSPRR